MKIMHLTCARRRLNAAGFSLIEVVIALVIVGIVTIGLFAGYSWSFSNIAWTRENLRATQILVEKAETIRLYSWEEISTNHIPTSFTNYYNPFGTGSQGTKYIGTMTFSAAPITASYSNDMKQFTIHIQWTNGVLTRSRDLTTYVARNGIQDYTY